ncbi:transcription elongation factor GreA [bacterium]|nr:transcription elongation factor GreA [bacterium]
MKKLITEKGLEKIKQELGDRKTRLRKEIAEAIKEAKEQGDLSENAEYSEAKRQQNENESRIAKLEEMIKNSQVVKRDKSANSVQLDSIIKVKSGRNKMEFHIVGSSEADPINFKISNESPIGRAFIGKSKGDKVEVETPRGKVKYEILEVI